jgi:hypothetical protein
MASIPDLLVFDPEDDGEVVDRMAAMVGARRGWVNLEPQVPDPENLPAGALGGGVFSNRGPAIPLCTWTAPTLNRKGVLGPQSIGVQHATGSRARPRLRELRLEVPQGWIVRGDHPKRGLVVELPADTDPATALDWLLAAGEALVTIEVTGRWHAAFYAG